MTRALILSTIIAIGMTAPGQAQQDTVPLSPGQRIRIHQSGKHPSIGAYLSADSSNVTIVTGPADTIGVPRATITRVDRSVGTRSKAPDGALIGLGVGMVGGVITGGFACNEQPNSWNVTQGECMVWGAVAFGLVGALVGVIAWSGERTDKWEPTSWPMVSILPVGPDRGMVALGVHVRF